MTRIGIFEGAFDPPHNGQISAVRAFMEQMWLDFVYVIPTAIVGESVTDAYHRLRMCQLAFGDMDGVYVSDAALLCTQSRSTADVLRELQAEDRRLFLLLGTDRLLDLGEDAQVSEIFSLSYPVYVRREQDALLDQKIIRKIADYQNAYGKVTRRIVTEPQEISSHAIREHCRRGESISATVPAMVEKYIGDNHLYV